MMRDAAGGGSPGDGVDLVMDVGTSAVKAACVDAEGAIVASVERALPAPTGEEGRSEQDAHAWWSEASQAAADVTSTVRSMAADVERIVLTGQMQTLTLVDEHAVPIRATVSYADVRAQDEARYVLDVVGRDALRSWTGNDTDASSLLAKAVWLLRHEPEVVRRAHGAHLGAADHLAARLLGRATTACDTTTASTTGLLDLTTRGALPAAAFAAVGLTHFAGLLPRFVPGGTEVGQVAEAAASAWGVRAGTPVHVAPGDAGATTIGAGAGRPGVASIYLGTSGWLAFTSTVRGRPEQGVFTLAHPSPDLWFQVAPLLTASGNLAWFRDAVRPGTSFDDLIDVALARPATSLVYLPYLAGERSPFRDPHVRASFVGLTAHTTVDDMARAVLEGVAFAYRHAAEALGAGDAPVGEAWVVSGGGARSRAWMQTFADVLARPIRILDDATWVGVRGAWRAAAAAREADGTGAAVERYATSTTGEVLHPRGGDRDLERRYQMFRQATASIRDVFAPT